MALVPFPGSASPDPDPWGDQEGQEGVGARMSFLEHLDELRKRLVVCVGAVGVTFLIAFAFVNKLYDFVMKPLAAMLPASPSEPLRHLDPNALKLLTPEQIKALNSIQDMGGKLIYTQPTEAFILYLKIAFLVGIIMAAPIILWQVWLFISPGLYRREKKFAVPFIAFASVFFVLGAAFTHYVLFPFMWKFLASFSNEYTLFAPRIEDVFSLYAKMILGMGIIFQMPTLVYFLARMRMVTARFLLKNFKYAILIIFILAAVITPSGDPWTQTLFAAPMIVLYLMSILIAWVFAPRRRPAVADAE